MDFLPKKHALCHLFEPKIGTLFTHARNHFLCRLVLNGQMDGQDLITAY